MTGTLGPRPRWLLRLSAAALLAGALLFPLYRSGTNRSVGGLQLGASGWVMGDFRSVVYYPARAFAEGVNPYDAPKYLTRYPAPQPFRAYPPATLLAHQPFALLGVKQATWIQALLIVGLTFFLAWLSLRLSRAPSGALAVAVTSGLVLLSRPGHWNLLLGQITVVMVIAAYAALALPRRRVAGAGISLAVAMFKPTFGVPLAVLMLARGQFAALGVGMVMTAALNLPVLAALAERSGGFARATRLLIGVGPRPEASDALLEFGTNRVDATAMVSRFAGVPLGPILPVVIGGSILGLAAYALRQRERRLDGEPLDSSHVGLACTAILLCIYHIGYDVLLLTWPATAAVTGRCSRASTRRLPRVQLVLLALLAANYLATTTSLGTLGLPPALALWVVSLNGLALLGLFVLYAWEAVSRNENCTPSKLSARM